MCDLVGNAARSGAITCVVSRRHPTNSAMSALQRMCWPEAANSWDASCIHVHLDWLDSPDAGALMCCAAVTAAVSERLLAQIATSPLTGRAVMGSAECMPGSGRGRRMPGYIMAAEEQRD